MMGIVANKIFWAREARISAHHGIGEGGASIFVASVFDMGNTCF